jgi:hypothetical protein
LKILTSDIVDGFKFIHSTRGGLWKIVETGKLKFKAVDKDGNYLLSSEMNAATFAIMLNNGGFIKW